MVEAVLDERLTYLAPANLAALARLVLLTERRGLEGLVVEGKDLAKQVPALKDFLTSIAES